MTVSGTAGGWPVRVSKAVLVSDRWFNAFVRLARGIFEGAWLGVLTPERLRTLDEEYYRGQAMYRQEGHNRRGLWGWEREALSTHFPAGSRVAVTGAGGGREVLAMLELGYDAFGFEPHAELAEYGSRLTEEAGYGRRVRRCGRIGWPEGAVGFTGVVVGWGSFMLMPGRAERVRYLRQARQSLPSGAPILLSFFDREGDSIRYRAAAALGTAIRRLRGDNRPVETGDALSPNYVHFFTSQEVQRELSDAGFDLISSGVHGYAWAVGRARPSAPVTGT